MEQMEKIPLSFICFFNPFLNHYVLGIFCPRWQRVGPERCICGCDNYAIPLEDKCKEKLCTHGQFCVPKSRINAALKLAKLADAASTDASSASSANAVGASDDDDDEDKEKDLDRIFYRSRTKCSIF